MKSEFCRSEKAIAAGLYSKPHWNSLGKAIITGATPDGWFRGRYRRYALYAVDQTRPKRIVIPVPPVRIDVLRAIFVVTRAAKRFRDAAECCYMRECHSFAKHNRKIKEHCYAAKDRGVLFAARLGRIAPVAAASNLTVYRGEGYCFHSPLRPVNWTPPPETMSEALPVIDAKPKEVGEPRLKDALFTLDGLPGDEQGFVRIPFPEIGFDDSGDEENQRSWRESWEAHCPDEEWMAFACGRR